MNHNNSMEAVWEVWQEIFKYFKFLEYREVKMGPDYGGKSRNIMLQIALYSHLVQQKKYKANCS